ncbi:MAG: 3-keto-5-aminohexanoate cleavage protein [Thermodesulfobacteriota bacterium]|nr:3-keto-5-aminohexanoate cleavage protein [Thermodesulfobacteriota bacterium]
MKPQELSFEDFFSREFPFIDEPEDKTMDKKLIINVATTGAFMTRKANPNQPFTPEEIAKEVIESYEAGASIWHVHSRDEKGIATSDPEIIKKTADIVFKECPDIITSISAWSALGKQGADLMRPIVDPLTVFGKEYSQMAVVIPVSQVAGPLTYLSTEETLTSIVTYLYSKGVVPEYQGFNFVAIENIKKWLIEPGVIKPPYVINAIMGTHAGVFYESHTTPYPWGLMYLMTMLENMPEGTVKGATIGGHNWLPMITAAIILGVDLVRIGMEDTIWMYPHKPDRIESSVDVVKKVVNITKELGREIATPNEARKILGLAK